MPIDRIEALTYSVSDVENCGQFLIDAGFAPVSATDFEASYRTAENQIITIVDEQHANLPKAFEDGSTLRELTWGVSGAQDLEDIAKALGDKASVEGNVVRTIDPNGLGLAFRVANKVSVEPTYQAANQNQLIERINQRLEAYGEPKPVRIVHVALNITKQKNKESLAFYTKLLKFKPIDVVLDTGTFLQSEGDIEHHNFFLCFRPDKAGINHFALELPNFDTVMEAGNHMITAGWKESRRPGRHKLGSNVYRFIHAPFGGRIEFVADMDRMDKSWKTKTYEKNPGHNIWMLKSSGGE